MRRISAASERDCRFILYGTEYSLHQRDLDCGDINYFFGKVRQSATKFGGKSVLPFHSLLHVRHRTESKGCPRFFNSLGFVEVSRTQLLNGGDTNP